MLAQVRRLRAKQESHSELTSRPSLSSELLQPAKSIIVNRCAISTGRNQRLRSPSNGSPHAVSWRGAATAIHLLLQAAGHGRIVALLRNAFEVRVIHIIHIVIVVNSDGFVVVIIIIYMDDALIILPA